jgi:hypothetical protein
VCVCVCVCVYTYIYIYIYNIGSPEWKGTYSVGDGGGVEFMLAGCGGEVVSSELQIEETLVMCVCVCVCVRARARVRVFVRA